MPEMSVHQKLHLTFYGLSLLSILLFVVAALAIIDVDSGASVVPYLAGLAGTLVLIIIAQILAGHFIIHDLDLMVADHQLAEQARKSMEPRASESGSGGEDTDSAASED